jgi:hypothetical protein
MVAEKERKREKERERESRKGKERKEKDGRELSASQTAIDEGQEEEGNDLGSLCMADSDC